MTTPPSILPEAPRRRLETWKEIASHLNRSVRTVQRWEQEEGLPVHRHAHQRMSSIYAYVDEVDAWWAQSKDVIAAAESDSPTAIDAPSAHEPVPAVLPSNETLPGRRSPVAFASLAVLALVVLAGLSGIQRSTSAARSALVAGSSAGDADALYREGRVFWHQRTPSGFQNARRSFEAAIAANPGHARSHAGLADTYSLLEAFGLMPAGEALPKARAAAERAVQLDPALGEAHCSLSFVFWELRDSSAAIAEIEGAIELDPANATARHWHSLYLRQLHQFDRAIAEGRKAVDLDPTRPIYWTDLAGLLRSAGRIDEAQALLREASRRHPAFPDIHLQLAELARAAGRDAEAIRSLRSAMALGDNKPRNIGLLGCLEAKTGNSVAAAEALDLLRRVEASGQHVPDDAYAVIFIATGSLDAAFERAMRAFDERQEWVGSTLTDNPCLAAIRQHPRWPELAGRLAGAAWLQPAGQPISQARQAAASGRR